MPRFLLMLSAVLAVARGASPSFGPWLAVLDRLGACTVADYKHLPPYMVLKMDKIKKGSMNRSVLDGEVNAPEGLTNDFEMLIRVEQLKKGNKWQVVVENEMGPACKAFSAYLKSVYHLVTDRIEGPEPYTDDGARCMKPGIGVIKGPFDFPPIDMTGIPNFFYGSYRGTVVFHHVNKTEIGCTEFDVSIVPKDKRKP